jgi:hypothetical protein
MPHLLFFLYEPLCMSLHPARAGLIIHGAAQRLSLPDPQMNEKNKKSLPPDVSAAGTDSGQCPEFIFRSGLSRL